MPFEFKRHSLGDPMNCQIELQATAHNVWLYISTQKIQNYNLFIKFIKIG